MNSILLFQVLAVALGAAAVFFLWQWDTEKMFVSGVLAAVSFLLSMRFQIKARIKERDSGDSKDIVQ